LASAEGDGSEKKEKKKEKKNQRTMSQGADLLVLLLEALANKLRGCSLRERGHHVLHQRRGSVLSGSNVVALIQWHKKNFNSFGRFKERR